MNFYKRHIGDYIRDAAHLSLLEHGVYTRLMDVYYTRESAIPDAQAARLIGARTKEEVQAVQNVLQEFFVLVDGSWRQERCEREIESANAKPGEQEDGKTSKAVRQQRYRERRKAIFDALRERGVVMPWDASMDDLQDALLRVTVTPRVTPETRNVTATISQTPDTISQEPEEQKITTTDVVVVDSVPADDLTLTPPDGKPAGRPDCPHQAIVALYHELLPASPGIRDWTPARAQALRARWNEDPKRQTLAYWRKFFEYVAASDFLTGRAKTHDGRKPFVASLDWIVKAENFAKIREGRYHEEVAA